MSRPDGTFAISDARRKRAVRLFELLVRSPQGVDIYGIGDEFGLNVAHPVGNGRQAAFGIIKDLRRLIGHAGIDDTRFAGYTVPIRREGSRQFYMLAARREDGVEWQNTRVKTLLSRVEIDLAYWQGLDTVITDHRTVEGRITRAYVKHFARLKEDIADVLETLEK